MRALLFLAAMIAFLYLLGHAYDAETATGQRPPSHVQIGDGTLIRAIRHERIQTWRCQNAINRPRSPVSYAAERSSSVAFRKWVHDLWENRADFHCGLARQLSKPIQAIHAVFGAAGHDAVMVARCESHLDVNAANGQYLGLFQMGSWARATYGHGPTALEQARAAYRYFRVAGWAPWACKP
jgi:hypothetical protein